MDPEDFSHLEKCVSEHSFDEPALITIELGDRQLHLLPRALGDRIKNSGYFSYSQKIHQGYTIIYATLLTTWYRQNTTNGLDENQIRTFLRRIMLKIWRPTLIALIICIALNAFPLIMAFVLNVEGWDQTGWALYILFIPASAIIMLIGLIISIIRLIRG